MIFICFSYCLSIFLLMFFFVKNASVNFLSLHKRTLILQSCAVFLISLVFFCSNFAKYDRIRICRVCNCFGSSSPFFSSSCLWCSKCFIFLSFLNQKIVARVAIFHDVINLLHVCDHVFLWQVSFFCDLK